MEEFDKDEVLSILQKKDYHSPEPSDDDRKKPSDGKRPLHVHNHPWRSDMASIKYASLYNINLGNNSISLLFLFQQLKHLLRDILDSAAESHHLKKRERIINDNVYFTSSKPPNDAPEWSISGVSASYDTEYETDFVVDVNDEDVEEQRDLAEMNVRPEDYDEVGESSTASTKVSSKLYIKN